MLNHRRLLLATLILSLIGLSAAFFGSLFVWCWFQHQTSQPFRAYLEPEVFVQIPQGSSIPSIASSLEKAGVIKSAFLFRIQLKIQEEVQLQAGLYRFDSPLSLLEVIQKLSSGEVFYRKLTIPEGTDLSQVAVFLVESGLGSLTEVMEEILNPSEISQLDPRAPDLEGYLMPDTYHLKEGSGVSEIVSQMVGNFHRHWSPEFTQKATELGLTIRQVVTLASLIEKETAHPQERELVSAVFHNRLRLGMRLMCDPTVIYAVKTVKEYDGVIHRSDLDLDSPYNTYLYNGLPPGPICNPGKESIRAALFPADVDYLYFVANNQGGHIFSRNYSAHRRAVQRYQR